MKLTCPSADRLREFLEGSLDDSVADQIVDHVDDCPSCNALISKLEVDQEHAMQKLRDRLRIEALLDEPELVRLRKTVACSSSDMASSVAHEAIPNGGKRLRDYRLVKKIGEGGMGTVYQAVHVHLGKSVAIKILPTDKLRSRHSVERFRQEMRAVGKVNHPNVVSASDAGAVDGQHFLVMELVEGADLARIIQDRGTLDVGDVCEIVRQAATGLQHAHDLGLVHRDVKPSNLMLAIDGTVKLLDLGLAGLNSTDFGPVPNIVITDRLTSVGQIMGTLDYMAPEQITASSQVDGRADVYALGATLFQLLTKRTPCGDRSAETPERIEAVLKQPPLEISKLRSDIPEGLCALIMKMLAKEPENRPQSANDVAEELSHFSVDADLVALAESCKTSLDMPSADVEITDDVSFVVSHLHTQDEVTPAYQSQPQRAWPRYVPVVGLAMFALMFGILLSVFTFRTKDGTVKVELPDGVDRIAIRIGLEQDGETVKIVDSAGDWEVRLAEGQYDVRLLQGADQFQVEKQTLVVESQQTAKVKVTWIPLPDPVAIFTSGRFEEGAKAAETLVDHSPDSGWNHAQAAMMWGSVPLIGGSPNENRENFEKHRQWLAKRWAETGEGANTIPRICCLRPDPPADLKAMLEAVTEESAQHPRDWRYPHSRMMLLYRLGRYQEALEVFADCRRISPTNRMHLAVDHAWSTMILYRLGRVEEGRKDHEKSMQLYHSLRPYGQRKLPEMWFDFVELGIILCELSLEFEHAPDMNEPLKTTGAKEPWIPYSLCTSDFRLVKWRPMSAEVMDVALSSNESTAAIALGGRPGIWEIWDVTSPDQSEYVFGENRITRHVGGAPIRSLGLHPQQQIAALGRWHGIVDIIDLETNRILATREPNERTDSKANRVRFANDGSHLLIGYQSSRLVDWQWTHNQTVAQHDMPNPVWNFSIAGDSVLHAGRIWNRRTGELRILTEEVSHGRFFDGGRKALLTFQDVASIVDVASGGVISTVELPSRIRGIAFLPLEKRMITGHDNGELRLVDLESSQHILLGRVHNNCAAKITAHTCNRILLTITDKRKSGGGTASDHQVAIWMLSENLELKPLEQIQLDSVNSELRRSAVRAAILEEL